LPERFKVTEPTLSVNAGRTLCSLRAFRRLPEPFLSRQERLTCTIETEFREIQLRSQAFYREPERKAGIPELIGEEDGVWRRFSRSVCFGL
jgi:hypothetical protein